MVFAAALPVAVFRGVVFQVGRAADSPAVALPEWVAEIAARAVAHPAAVLVIEADSTRLRC